MKAFIQTGFGDPDKDPNGDITKVQLTDIDKPDEPTGDQVLIKVYAASINPVDAKRTVLNFEGDNKNTLIIGYDVAGIVQAVGEQVNQFKQGDRVFGDILADTLGPKTTGSFAEYTLAPAHTLAKIPHRVSFTDAAALPLVCQTAIQVLRKADAKVGQNLFITAGAGGVGLHVMQIAKALFDISKVATTASRTSEHLVKKYGADIVIDYHTQNAGEVLKDWADIVFDTTLENEMEKEVVKQGGKLMSIVWSKDDAFQNVLIQPSSDDIKLVANLLDERKLVPVVDTVYPFSDVVKAFQHSLSGHSKGKIVVKMVDE